MSGRFVAALVIGLVMFAIGAYIAVRPLWAPGRPVSGQLWLDWAFAAFFMLRGWMNVRSALNARDGGRGTGEGG